MGYLIQSECENRLSNVRKILEAKKLDLALIYYDEFNIGNGWYLTGWCPQFESGAVLVPRKGNPMLLGGPESEPFAKQDSAITETRNFPVFMVPDEEYPAATIISFPELFAELNNMLGEVKAIGLVGGGRMPAECYSQIVDGFSGVKIEDITNEYLKLRYIKSDWEREQIAAAFKLADDCYDAMKDKVAPNVMEIEVAAVGEYAARSQGATSFGFSAIVGSGSRANAVVPTATTKKMVAGETVMVGLAPKVNGYAGVVGDFFPVSGEYTESQKECLRILRQAFVLTKNAIAVGKTGREVDAPARELFTKLGLDKYLVCPFVHTIGLHEAEAPFFGPGSDDVLVPGMTICIDVSFFGHPEWHGARIETGYEVTANGLKPFSPKLDAIHSNLDF